MIVSTLIFTVVFGSDDQNTGSPILLETMWFTIFAAFQGLGILLSAFSVICFMSIRMYSMEEVHFARHIPNWFAWGFKVLQISILAVVAVFVSA